MFLIVTFLLIGYVESANLAYTIESSAEGETKCLTNCVNGQCMTGYGERKACIPEWRKAATYDTTKYRSESTKCLSECAFAGYDYSWCYVDDLNWDYCIPDTGDTADSYQTILDNGCNGKCGKGRVARSLPPRKTVAEYNQDINNDNSLTTVTLSTKNNFNCNNPVLDYTYRIRNGLKLTVRIRANILPCHVQPSNSRTNNAISPEAKTNCDRMGMYLDAANSNSDEYGHLIPYILKGPSDWYNILPQTKRINRGTMTNTDMRSRSVWRDTERIMLDLVRKGGSIEYNVLVAYQASSTRPTGFGTTERHFKRNGALDYESLGYWYSNDPNEDPDVWN